MGRGVVGDKLTERFQSGGGFLKPSVIEQQAAIGAAGDEMIRFQLNRLFK
jgi:hypothetical protein